MKKNIKAVAAVSAVIDYLKTEEACLFAADAEPQEEQAAASTVERRNPWGAAGRQHQMQIRSMMQMKGFHRSG